MRYSFKTTKVWVEFPLALLARAYYEWIHGQVWRNGEFEFKTFRVLNLSHPHFFFQCVMDASQYFDFFNESEWDSRMIISAIFQTMNTKKWKYLFFKKRFFHHHTNFWPPFSVFFFAFEKKVVSLGLLRCGTKCYEITPLFNTFWLMNNSGSNYLKNGSWLTFLE